MRSLHSKRPKESFSFSIIKATGMDKAELNSSMSQLIGSKGFWFRKTSHKYQQTSTSLPTTSSDPGHPVCLNLPWQSPSTRGVEGPVANSLLEHSWGMTSWNLECHWETQRQGLVCDKPLKHLGRHITLMPLRALRSLRLTWSHFTKCCQAIRIEIHLHNDLSLSAAAQDFPSSSEALITSGCKRDCCMAKSK